MVILPNDHRLAALKSISPRDLMGETFVVVSQIGLARKAWPATKQAEKY